MPEMLLMSLDAVSKTLDAALSPTLRIVAEYELYFDDLPLVSL